MSIKAVGGFFTQVFIDKRAVLLYYYNSCVYMQIFFRKVVCLLEKKLKLYGFNNLTKTLSFNIYDVCYAKGAREQKEYIDYIDEQYNSERLTGILCDVTDIIGANVLNISKQDYDPQGASVTLLISEKATDSMEIDKSCNRGMVDGKPLHPQRGAAAAPETVVAHLDKSCTLTPNITPTTVFLHSG